MEVDFKLRRELCVTLHLRSDGGNRSGNRSGNRTRRQQWVFAVYYSIESGSADIKWRAGSCIYYVCVRRVMMSKRINISYLSQHAVGIVSSQATRNDLGFRKWLEGWRLRPTEYFIRQISPTSRSDVTCGRSVRGRLRQYLIHVSFNHSPCRLNSCLIIWSGYGIDSDL
ncbi:hypothetical protein BDR06DRAFT_319284 [Suillus hirtellus]|nr:hypothetical protein BDR06DRAFT_319284 [Suillus hirtellus]